MYGIWLLCPPGPFIARSLSQDPTAAIIARRALTGSNSTEEEVWERLEEESTDQLIHNIANERVFFDEAVMRIVILDSRGVTPAQYDEKNSYIGNLKRTPSDIAGNERREFVRKLRNQENDPLITKALTEQYRASGLLDSKVDVLAYQYSEILDRWLK